MNNLKLLIFSLLIFQALFGCQNKQENGQIQSIEIQIQSGWKESATFHLSKDSVTVKIKEMWRLYDSVETMHTSQGVNTIPGLDEIRLEKIEIKDCSALDGTRIKIKYLNETKMNFILEFETSCEKSLSQYILNLLLNLYRFDPISYSYLIEHFNEIFPNQKIEDSEIGKLNLYNLRSQASRKYHIQ